MMEVVFDYISALSHESLGLALNGIWLGIVLTGLVFSYWRIAKTTNAATRYGVWWVVLTVVIILPFIMGSTAADLFGGWTTEMPAVSSDLQGESFVVRMDKASQLTEIPAEVESHAVTPLVSDSFGRANTLAAERSTIESAGVDGSSRSLTSLLLGVLPVLLFVVWLSTVTLLLWRLACAYRRITAVKRNCTPLDCRGMHRLNALLESSSRKRTVRVGLSSEIDIPVAAGLGKAVILIPERLYDELGQTDLEAIILHELAHILRWDDWAKLGQKIVEAVLFFHPAVHWIGRQLNLERELACDDRVMLQTGRPDEYYRCLTRLVQLTTGTGTTLVAPGALTNRKQIFRRFERLLTGKKGKTTRFSRLRFLGALAIVLVALLVSVRVAPVVAVPVEVANYTELNDALRSLTTDHSAEQTVTKSPEMMIQVSSDEPNESAATSSEENDESNKIQDQLNNDQSDVIVQMSTDEPTEPTPITGDEVGEGGPTQDQQISKPDAALAAPAPPRPARPARPAAAPEAPEPPSAPEAPSIRLASEDRTGPAGRTLGTAFILDDGIKGLILDRSENIRGTGMITWSDGRDKLSVSVDGEVELSDDDRSVESISEDGYLYVMEKRGSRWREVEIEPKGDGGLEYTYYIRGESEEFDNDAREWLADALVMAVRRLGLGAERRVHRIFKRDGVDGVLREIRKIESDYVKRIYFRELIDGAELQQDDYSRVLRTAARVLESDYEKAELLVDLSDKIQSEPKLFRDYVDVVATFESDYETRRVLSAISLGDNVDKDLTIEVLRIADRMDSDYEKAELLIEMAPFSSSDPELLHAYVLAVEEIDSDYETRRVLSALSMDDDIDQDIVLVVLDIAENMDSDYEKAELLIDMSGYGDNNHQFRDAYVRAVEGIDSDYETRRVLSALSMDGELDRNSVLRLLQIADGMDSDYEKAEFMIDLADRCRDDSELRTLFINTAATLDSDYETRRVLSSMHLDCDSSPEQLLAVLQLTAEISSDYESTELLLELVDCAAKDPAVRRAYLNAVRRVDSDYETKRALMALIQSSDIDGDMVLGILPIVERIDSDYEKSEILKQLAKYCRGNNLLEAAYEQAAETIDSDYERDEVYELLYGKRGRSKDNMK